jgi:hypothetical protein
MTEPVEPRREPHHRRDRRILFWTVSALAVGIAMLAAAGRYAFIWKTAVVPLLLLAALFSRRLARFIEDWGVFLGLVIVFDFVRGLIFAVVTHWQLPVYMQYAIHAERWLCGGHILPVLAQQWRARLAWPDPVDRMLTIVHGSHFAFFLLFGLAVWMLRPEYFRRYAASVLALIYAGAVLYLAVPTIPPWMAADLFGVLPPLLHISSEIYNTNLPTLHEAFDVNPIAAMPSLHAALPTLCVLHAANLFGWRALAPAAYLLTVYVAIVYLGEHYLVDVVAGAGLAVAVFFVVRPGALATHTWRSAPAVRPALAMALLIITAVGIGQLTVALRSPFTVTPAFAARELTGRTPIAHLHLGRFALERGDLVRARHELELAVARIETTRDRHVASRWLAQTARLERQSSSDARAVRSE